MNEKVMEVVARAICDHAEVGKYDRLLAASLNEIQAMGKLRKIRYQAQAVYDSIEAAGYSVVQNEKPASPVKDGGQV